MAANAVGSSRKRAASGSRIAAWQLSEVGGVEAVDDGVPMIRSKSRRVIPDALFTRPSPKNHLRNRRLLLSISRVRFGRCRVVLGFFEYPWNRVPVRFRTRVPVPGYYFLLQYRPTNMIPVVTQYVNPRKLTCNLAYNYT